MNRYARKIIALVLLPFGATGLIFCLAMLLDQDIYANKWARHYSVIGAIQCVIIILAGFYSAYPGKISNTFNQFSQRLFTEDKRQKIAHYLIPACIAGIIIFGILLRLNYYSENRSFWHDPACLAVAVADVSFGDILKPLANGQSAPLGFLILSKIIGMHFDYQEFALTFLPLVFGIFSLPALYLLGNELFQNKYTLLFVAFVAFSLDAVYYSTEFKQYSSDIFFSTMILYFTIRAYNNNLGKKDYTCLAVAGLVSIWFSHAAIIVSAGCGLGLAAVFIFIKRVDRKALLKIISLGAIWLFNLMANYFLYTRDSIPQRKYEYFADGFAPFPIVSLADIKWYIDAFLGLFSHPLSFGYVPYFFPLIFLLTGLIYTFKKNKDYGLIILFPILILLALSMIGKYPFVSGVRLWHARLILFTVPIFYFLIVQGIRALAEKSGSNFLYLIIVIFILNHQILHLSLAAYHREETRPLVEHYLTGRKSDDRIYVYSESVCAFKYYTRHTDEPFIRFEFPDNVPDEEINTVPKPPEDGGAWFLLSHITKNKKHNINNYLNKTGLMKFVHRTDGASLYYYEFSNKD